MNYKLCLYLLYHFCFFKKGGISDGKQILVDIEGS